ncbi:MAG: ribosomal protein S18 acetylase RimI-like enzyme [Nitrospinales bacterium]|jgi:ribosomal protein S18 acetylase RimI-like enzyme
MNVTIADSSSISKLANLFNQYRIFYGAETDIQAATSFMKSRFKNKDSVILIAHENSQMGGFIQLYPSFSSVGMQKIWILNDLFVNIDFRRQNVARNLMEAAKKYAKETGALRIDLATQISNIFAQNLYESMGYTKNESFFHYSLPLKI